MSKLLKAKGRMFLDTV